MEEAVGGVGVVDPGEGCGGGAFETEFIVAESLAGRGDDDVCFDVGVEEPLDDPARVEGAAGAGDTDDDAVVLQA